MGFWPEQHTQNGPEGGSQARTTTNFHDNWTIGYAPDLLVGVWVGNSNYEAMHNVTGLTGAAPIWHEIMRTILQGHPDQPFVRPDGLVQVEVCDLSGLLPTPACRTPNWNGLSTARNRPKQIRFTSRFGSML